MSGLPGGMDNDFYLDYDEIVKTIRSADVVTFRFVVINQRLLIDNRSSEIDPPLVKVVPRATSVEDRFRSLKQLRPRFRLPEKISAIWWPKSIASMVEHSVWDAIVQRIIDGGFAKTGEECDDVLSELRELERQEVLNAISGESYQSLWGK